MVFKGCKNDHRKVEQFDICIIDNAATVESLLKVGNSVAMIKKWNKVKALGMGSVVDLLVRIME